MERRRHTSTTSLWTGTGAAQRGGGDPPCSKAHQSARAALQRARRISIRKQEAHVQFSALRVAFLGRRRPVSSPPPPPRLRQSDGGLMKPGHYTLTAH